MHLQEIRDKLGYNIELSEIKKDLKAIRDGGVGSKKERNNESTPKIEYENTDKKGKDEKILWENY